MELSLKIDLTDQQYQDLMKKSFNTISERPETIEEIQKTIVQQMSDYLKNHQEVLKEFLGITGYGYGGNVNTNKEVVKKLVNKGLEDYGKEISDGTKDAIKDMMKHVNFMKIFEHFFYKSMLNGFKEAIIDDLAAQDNITSEMQFQIDTIKSRLGLN